jgi:hypothetical protein
MPDDRDALSGPPRGAGGLCDPTEGAGHQDPVITSAGPDDTPVPQELCCGHCGYALRGFRVCDACPECGWAARDSMDNRLVNAPLAWLHVVRAGVLIGAGVQIVWAVMILDRELLSDFPARRLMPWWGVYVVLSLVDLVGIWFLTWPEARGSQGGVRGWLRGFAAVEALGRAGVTLGLRLVSPHPDVGAWVQYAVGGVGLGLVGLLSTYCYAEHLKALALRVPAPELRQPINLALLASVTVSMIFLVSYLLLTLHLSGFEQMLGMVEELHQLGLRLGAAASLVLTVVLLRFHRVLRKLQRMARPHAGGQGGTGVGLE